MLGRIEEAKLADQEPASNASTTPAMGRTQIVVGCGRFLFILSKFRF